MSRYIYIVQLQYSDIEDCCRIFSSFSTASIAFERYRSTVFPNLVNVFLKRALLDDSRCGHFAYILDRFRCGK